MNRRQHSAKKGAEHRDARRTRAHRARRDLTRTERHSYPLAIESRSEDSATGRTRGAWHIERAVRVERGHK